MSEKVFNQCVSDNANQMRSYAIIEDLDFEHYEDFIQKNHEDKLTDCLIRNFPLIKYYAHCNNQLFITKFKKKIIPKYFQQLEDYCHSQLAKNRQLLYVRRKNSTENSFYFKKNQKSLPGITKISTQYQQNPLLSDQILETCSLNKSFPILFNDIPVPKKHIPCLNLGKTHIEKPIPSQKFIWSPMFTSSNKKITEINKISKEKQSKSYATIHSESINFCQNFLFKKTLNQIRSKRQSRQQTQGFIQIFNVKRTLADEKNIEKKMMNVLKKRKSSKTLKMKIFSGYINSKKSQLLAKDKENTEKVSFNELNKQGPQVLLKKNMKKLRLKGKLCIPMKNHRVTTSCLLQRLRFPLQNLESLNKMIDLPSVNGRSSIVNSTQNNFRLPNFS